MIVTQTYKYICPACIDDRVQLECSIIIIIIMMIIVVVIAIIIIIITTTIIIIIITIIIHGSFMAQTTVLCRSMHFTRKFKCIKIS